MFLWKISFLSLVLVGCASLQPPVKQMSAEQCVDSEWQEVGLRDGRLGNPQSPEFNRYVSECSKVLPSLESEKAAYGRGLEEGYVVYCHSANAENMGVLGTVFREDFCAKQERPGLQRAYRKGLARTESNSKTK